MRKQKAEIFIFNNFFGQKKAINKIITLTNSRKLQETFPANSKKVGRMGSFCERNKKFIPATRTQSTHQKSKVAQDLWFSDGFSKYDGRFVFIFSSIILSFMRILSSELKTKGLCHFICDVEAIYFLVSTMNIFVLTRFG